MCRTNGDAQLVFGPVWLRLVFERCWDCCSGFRSCFSPTVDPVCTGFSRRMKELCVCCVTFRFQCKSECCGAGGGCYVVKSCVLAVSVITAAEELIYIEIRTRTPQSGRFRRVVFEPRLQCVRPFSSFVHTDVDPLTVPLYGVCSETSSQLCLILQVLRLLVPLTFYQRTRRFLTQMLDCRPLYWLLMLVQH